MTRPPARLLSTRLNSPALLMAAMLAAAAFCGASGCAGPAAKGAGTTLVIVRHAERDPGADPPLNAEGLRRAEALKTALGDARPTAIYCTDLIRNRQTAEPLAKALNLTSPILIPEAAYADTRMAANDIIGRVRARHPGEVVLWVGNLGSAKYPNQPGINQAILEALGGKLAEPARYSDLYIAVIPATGPPARIIRASYGGPSSLDAK